MKSSHYAKASETQKRCFLHVSYTFPTLPHREGEGVGNVGNTYRFPTFLRPRCAAVRNLGKGTPE